MAGALGAQPHSVLVASTGVIAEDLPVERIDAALPGLVAGLEPATSAVWEAAAAAIGTTDTFPKGASAPVHGTSAHVAGIAKGSGMIAPDMATMLAFVFTDLALDSHTAQECLADSVERSFNRITVDSDTSTSDTVILAATGTSPQSADLHLAAFRDALDAVTLDLAHQIVRDGEGATKFVAVTVTGAADAGAAQSIARAVADSPLVKTALAASDANWGRIVAAVGKAGQRADRDRLSIWIGDEQCADGGLPRSGIQRAAGDRAPAGRQHRPSSRRGRGRRRGHRVDLRPHPRLHRHQRGVQDMSEKPERHPSGAAPRAAASVSGDFALAQGYRT